MISAVIYIYGFFGYNGSIGRDRMNSQWFNIMDGAVCAECERLLQATDEMRAQGTVIYPPSKDVLNALKTTPPSKVKAVIIGQDPYHDEGQAMGLSFSVPKGVKLPPSLRNIFKELHDDIGCDIPESGDLTSWAKQGVLLLNTVLTVEAHKANSHKKLGWQTVTLAVLKTCAALEQPVVFICWGKPALALAQAAMDESGRTDNYIIASTHPSPLSANNRKSELHSFMGSKPFSKSNEILNQNGIEPIQWSFSE